MKRGQVPVLFVIEMRYFEGRNKAYLHDNDLSAHPEEQEVLLGGGLRWKVTTIKEETLDSPNTGPFEGWVIYLEHE